MSDEPAPKKRRLQPFNAQPKAPPRKLQDGRTLKVERKQGEWPAHVYLEVELPPSFLEVLRQAAEGLHQQTGVKVNLQTDNNLHISLSRDLYLRPSQRDALKQVGQTLAQRRTSSFPLSFARVRKLVNENNSRAFLAVEVGGGHNEVLDLVHGLDALLTSPPLNLPPSIRYYDPPILHASFAWSVPKDPAARRSDTETSPTEASQLWSDEAIATVQDQLQTKIRKGALEAAHVRIRIGQDVYQYPFS